MKFATRVRYLLGRPTKRRYAFIITYGRSGSTLLMNLINSCDGCCIRGENNGALHSLYQSYRKIIEAQEYHGKNAHRVTSPWRGIMNVDSMSYARRLVSSFVDEVIKPGPDDFLCGFKEIRFSVGEVPDLLGYVKFIQEFFPGAQIIFNHRNLDDVSVSKWWGRMPDARARLAEMDARFNEIEESSVVFHFYYDEAVNNRDHVRDMFRFLNISYDDQAVSEVFANRQSY